MDFFGGGQLLAQRLDEAVWEQGDAVFAAFTVPYNDLAITEVDIFDAQANAFHKAQAGAVEQACHELVGVRNEFDELAGFFWCEHRRDALRFAGQNGIEVPFEFDLENVFVEEKQSTKSLILG